jgi:predicted nucleic acid-binding protein
MKYFLDANILISAVNKEYPLYTFTSRILSMMEENSDITLVTTNICLAITFYFAEKKHGTILAKSKVGLLVEHLHIAECGTREAVCAMNNKKVHDFEDGLQYYAALHDNCSCIVTNDLEDFYFSDLPVFSAERFYRKHI